MIKTLKQLFEQQLKRSVHDQDARTAEHAVRIATAALLIETARADFEFDEHERQALDRLIGEIYGLSREERGELLRIAEAEVEVSISLDQFTRLLDRNLSPAQKCRVVELLWQVAFADGRVDKYEEYLIRKLADLLHVPHKAFISAKLAAAHRGKEK